MSLQTSGAEILRREFQRRRRALMRHMGRGTIAIVPTAPERLRSRDVEHPYRPDSDFYYLTGFGEPDAVVVLVPGRPEGEYLLFCRPRDRDREIWTGRRAGLEGACAEYAADQAYLISALDEELPKLLQQRRRVFFPLGRYSAADQSFMQGLQRARALARSGVHAPSEIVLLDAALHELRLIKSRAELAMMRCAADIAGRAHVRAMRACRPGLTEHAIEAEFLHEFRSHGAVPSYPPIVAGGANACVLHYTENNAPLQDGDLLLIDAGAEVACYASDITRTFPVNGRFSPEQRAVYTLVLRAQEAAIRAVRPGVGWNAAHEAAVRVLTQGLVALGLLKGKPKDLIKNHAYRRFYMHRTGHWLGMDVHDVGAYKQGTDWRPLEPGMVLTVEPGLYIAPGSRAVPRRYWGIGVRIEDDVVVTRDGCRVLTDKAPKQPDAIEALMRLGK